MQGAVLINFNYIEDVHALSKKTNIVVYMQGAVLINFNYIEDVHAL
jgi:hypothetical protein